MKILSIIDRYLIGKFLAVLFFSLIAMVTIFVAVNYVENADKFIDRKVPGDIVFEYYLNFIPNIITLTLPVDILLASLFSLGSLARFNELTAVKAAGVSIYRVVFPLIIIAMIVSLANFWISENIVPASNSTKTEIWKTYVDRAMMSRRMMGNNISLYDPEGTKVFIEKFDKKNIVCTNISIQKFYGFELVSRVDAHEARWDSLKSAWLLKNGTQRRFENEAEIVHNFSLLEKTDLFFHPDDILKREQNPDEMNFVELNSFIKKLRLSGARTERWEVDYHLKFAYPLTCFFMVVFGAPLAASRKKSGAGLNIFLTLVICFGYYSMIQLGRFMGYNQTLDPIQAAWIGNGIFGCLSILIFIRLRS
ncbi:LptF/LptG family permease [bacterium]|nr:LptF/LptG family permease [bacterium]